MGWMGWVSELAKQAAHVTEDVSCKWLIGGLSAFIMLTGAGAVAWIKSILKELADERAARVFDCKEQIAAMRHKRRNQEDSDAF